MQRKHFVFMSALGVALSAGAAAVAAAFDTTEKFVVTGALKVTHTITEQVCDFDTLDQLETYLSNVADRHNWFRHDIDTAPKEPTTTAEPLAAPMDLAAIVGDTSAAPLEAADQAGVVDTAAQLPADVAPFLNVPGASQGSADAPAPEVRFDLNELRTGVAADAVAAGSSEIAGQADQVAQDSAPADTAAATGTSEQAVDETNTTAETPAA